MRGYGEDAVRRVVREEEHQKEKKAFWRPRIKENFGESSQAGGL